MTAGLQSVLHYQDEEEDQVCRCKAHELVDGALPGAGQVGSGGKPVDQGHYGQT